MSRRLIVVAAVAAFLASVAATPVTGAADPEAASLRTYLSSMSWPVRASLARAGSVATAIDGVLSPGDPPFLRQVAGNCRSLREVEARGRLLQIASPARLQTNHRGLSRAYSEMRAGCKQARLTALAVSTAADRFDRTRSAADKAAWERAEAAARQRLRRFARTTLPSFSQAVRSWRSAALRYAATLGVPPAQWVKELPVG